MVEELQPTSEGVEQQTIPFETLKEKVQAFLLDPQSGNPTEEVNRYFEKGGLSNWTPEDSVDAIVLLRIIKAGLDEPSEAHFDPKYGNAGTITMHLPYFYPLHLGILGLLVLGRVESAREESYAMRKGIARNVLEQTREFDVYGLHIERLTDCIRETLLPEDIQNTVVRQTETPRKVPWYRRINPLRK